jgi:hypothetical protein
MRERTEKKPEIRETVGKESRKENPGKKAEGFPTEKEKENLGERRIPGKRGREHRKKRKVPAEKRKRIPGKRTGTRRRKPCACSFSMIYK